MHSWPSPPINLIYFIIYRLFFSLCLPPFLVSLSVFSARKFCLLESLFLDKNSDSLYLNLIIFILCDGYSIGWAVAVADAGGVDGRFCCCGGSICRGG
jgi:hypothetical protein